MKEEHVRRMRAKAFPIGTRAYECFATRQMRVENMTLKIRAVEAKGNVLVWQGRIRG